MNTLSKNQLDWIDPVACDSEKFMQLFRDTRNSIVLFSYCSGVLFVAPFLVYDRRLSLIFSFCEELTFKQYWILYEEPSKAHKAKSS